MKAEEKKLIKNSALLFMGSFASKLLVFLLVPLYTSILSTDEYAIADLMTTTVSLVYPICTMMISTAVLRFCMERSVDRGQVLSIGVWVEAIGYSIGALAGFAVIRHTSLAPYAVFYIPYLIFYATDQLFLQYAKGSEKVHVYALASVISTLTLIGCNVLFMLVFNMGVNGYIAAMVISYCITTVYLFVATRAWKAILSPRHIDRQLCKEMTSYSLPMMPNTLSWWISNSSDRYIMARFCDMSMLGLYSVAYKIPSILVTITGILMSAWELSAVDDFGSDRSKKFFADMHQRYFDMLVVTAVVIIALVKPLALVLFQKDFYQAWKYVPILVYASVFNGLSAFVGTIFTASKHTSSIFTTTLLGAVTNIILNLALIPIIGGQGAAIATAAGYIIIYVIRLYKSRRIIPLSIPNERNALVSAVLLALAILTYMDSVFQYLVIMLLIFIERNFIAEAFIQIVGIAGKLAGKFQKNRR